MKIKKLISVIICSSLVFVCLPFSVSAKNSIPDTEYAENEVVFEYTSYASRTYSSENFQNSPDSSFSELGIESLREVFSSSGDNNILTRSISPVTTTYVAEISGDVLETCEKLQKIDGVNYAEPNYIYSTMEFTMPYEVSAPLNGYKNYQKWYFNDIMSIPTAWQQFETTGSNVLVAIIDNGYNLSAVDFPVNLWNDGNGNHGWNTHLNSNDISPIFASTGEPLPNTSHGSNVAGIIGMASNSSGMIGAAYGATLMLINSAYYINDTTESKFLSSDIAAAVNYARTNNADIINLSLGSSVYSSAIKKSIDAAYSAGIAIFAAAGNGYYNSEADCNYPYSTEDTIFYPAAASNVIGVMAIDKTNTSQLAIFSNYDPSGKYYDIAAPGIDILGCFYDGTGYSMNSGTSQACPLVAACAALYLSKYPYSTVDELYNAIKNSSTKRVSTNTTAVTGKAYYFKSIDALELLQFGEIKPKINANLETAVTIDNTKNYIYGLDEGYADIASYVTVENGTGTAVFTPASNGNGTGSVLDIYDLNGELYKSYTIIIFGDVNGDCHANGEDAFIMSCIINNLTTYPDCIKFAADVDFSDSVTADDFMITFNYAIGLDMVFQSR